MFMRKNLFFAGALALISAVSVSAQDWSHTLAQGLPGEQITHEVNGTEITQYRAVTKLFNHPGTNGVRYTVLETGTSNQIKGGGPCWAMAEMIVLDANGDTVQYTVDSNADHNTMGGAGTDGAGMPGLNDGNLNNFFHSTWSDNAPSEYHYIELTFEQPVDAFQLIWYTRPNQHVNKPQVVGLSPLGVQFTEPYGEYQFELGEQVNSLEALAEEPGLFTIYAEGPESYTNGEGTETTGPGNIYVALPHGNAACGDATDATPKNIMQLIPIPGKDNTFVIYQPVMGAYWASPSNWTSGWSSENGQGWVYGYQTASTLGEFTFSLRPDGEYEISIQLEGEYVNSEWNAYDEPLTVYVGYDMRGNLKLFSAENKALLEAGDLESGSFHLPVDFGFAINKASVAEGTVEPISVASICENVINPTIADAKERLELYGDHEGNVSDSKDALEAAIAAAEEAIAANDIAGIFAAKDELSLAISYYMSERVWIYNNQIEDLRNNTEFVYPPYTVADEGKWPASTESILSNAEAVAANIESNYETLTPSQIDDLLEQLAALIEQFKGSALKFSTFPQIVSDIPAATHPNFPNNAVWNSSAIVLHQDVPGIRLTFLERHLGTAGDGGNWPMIALGELKLYDAEGNEITLTEENLWANYTETQEGFESTVARLCDGVWGQGDGVTEGSAAGSYYHSPWSGSEPQEFICIDVTFPEPMSSFAVELYSRDKSTSNGAVSLFPKKIAITEVGVGYDPLLFAENPYNVAVGERVTDVAQIEDGLYVIKGLINTHPVWNVDAETGLPTGKGKFYAGGDAFHDNAAAVRANCVYRITKNADGTYTFLSLSEAKYWPSETERGSYLDLAVSKANAAKLTIVPSTSVLEDAFVIYEHHPELEQKDSIDTDEDGVVDSEKVTKTPYVVYMDWSTLAARPVTDPQPRAGINDTIPESEGENLYFNKGSGEGEWQIYKVATMDNPDFFWLENMLGIVSGLGLEVGPDPGCVASLGDLEEAYTKGQAVVADSAFAEATAAANALAEKIGLAETLEKNPMVPGYYRIQSAYNEFYKQQGHTKSVYANEDGTVLGWKKTETDNVSFYFHFAPAAENVFTEVPDLVAAGTITEEEAAQAYSIRAVGTTTPAAEFFIGEVDGRSTQIDLADGWASDYLVLPATGSNFNLALAKRKADCLHANGHGSGAGSGSNLVYWEAAPMASQWRLIKVDYEPTSIENLVAEGDEVVSVAYYTVGGASSSAPAKGVNIVKIVYANGVVETKKVLVK